MEMNPQEIADQAKCVFSRVTVGPLVTQVLIVSVSVPPTETN